MKTVAYTALHYGKEYLAYAIRSVINHVDEHHILYAAQGSHGHRTDLVCPETRDELYAIAQKVAGTKLRWHDGEWTQEAQQRESIFEYAPDADVILTVDADEVWTTDAVWAGRHIWEMVERGHPDANPVRRLRLPVISFWRSFWKACLNPDYPVRITFPKLPDGERAVDFKIAHFGYAQGLKIVEYKQHTHGHKPEWRWDWYDTKFKPNAQEDCHPTNVNFWSPVDVDPLCYMPVWMATHPYFNLKVIE